jgi:hypothetical protein
LKEKRGKKMKKNKIIVDKSIELASILLLFTFTILLSSSYLVIADPIGPDSIVNTANETKPAPSAIMLNTSGGYISTINITATTQNSRWKAYVGNVTGKLTLDDATGATIYDWTLSSVTGEIYATRNSSTIIWSNIKCANTTILENENQLMNHTNLDDNITKTFSDTTHSSFYVGSVQIQTNSCPTLNTYVNNATQDTDFEEMALWDGVDESGGALVYATILEEDVTGFDSKTYDFQMLVPENGAPTWTQSTAYYFYIELT